MFGVKRVSLCFTYNTSKKGSAWFCKGIVFLESKMRGQSFTEERRGFLVYFKASKASIGFLYWFKVLL